MGASEETPMVPDSRNKKVLEKKTFKKEPSSPKKKVLSSAAREEMRTAKFLKSSAKISDPRSHDPRVRQIVKKEIRNLVQTKVKKHKYSGKDTLNTDDLFEEDDSKIYGADDVKVDNYEGKISDLRVIKDMATEAASARKIVKKAIMEVFHKESVKKEKAIDKARDLKGTVFSNDLEVKTPKAVVKNKVKKPTEFTKEQKAQLRASNNRRKEHKKVLKKERQLQRKVDKIDTLITEGSSEYHIRPLEEFLPVSVCDIVEEYCGDWSTFESEKTWDLVVEAGVEDLLHEDGFPFLDLGDGEPKNFWNYAPTFTGYGIVSTLFAWERNTPLLFELDYYMHPILIICRSKDSMVFNAGINILFERLELVNGICNRNVWSIITTRLFNRFTGRFNKLDLVAEGGITQFLNDTSDLLQKGADVGSTLMHGEFYKTLRTLLLTVVAMGQMPTEFVPKVVSIFGKEPVGQSWHQLVINLLKSTSSMLTMAARLSKGEDPMSVILGEDAYFKNLNDLRELHGMRDFLYTGIPVQGRMDEVEWCEKVNKVVPYCQNIMKSFSPLSGERKEVERIINDLRRKKDEIMIRIKCSSRLTPLLFYVHGNPGVGKSKIIDFIFAMCAQAKGREFSHKMVFQRNVLAKHWDSYDPPSQPYIHYSEVGNKQPSILSTKGDAGVEELLSIIDSQPFPVPMARLEDKNRFFANPEVVVNDGNIEDMGVPHIMRNENAFRRRRNDIIPTVKPEFATPSGQIDPTKSNNSKVKWFDKWTFQIQTYSADPSKPKGYATHVHYTQASIFELASWIQNLYTKHFANEAKSKAIVDDPKTYEGYLDDPKNYHKPKEIEEKDFYEKYEEKIPPDDTGDDLKTEVGAESVNDFFVNRRENLVETVFGVSTRFRTLSDSVMRYIIFSIMDMYFNNVKNLVGMISVALVALYVYLWVFGRDFISLSVAVYFIYVMWEPITFLSGDVVATHRNAHRDVVTYRWNNLLRYLGYAVDMRDAIDDVKTLLKIHKYKILGGSLATAGLAYMAYSHFSKEDLTAEGSSDFVSDTKASNIINELEEKMDCGDSYRRVNKENVLWNIVHPTCSNPHTSGLKGLHDSVKRNVREVVFFNEEKNTQWTTLGIGLKSNIMILNTHVFKNYDRLKLKIAACPKEISHEQYISVYVDKNSRYDAGNDITLIHTDSLLFKDITEHIYDGKDFSRSLPAMIDGEKTGAELIGKTVARNGDQLVVLDKSYQYNWSSHAGGKCGTPLLAKHDKRCFIVGIHFAGRMSNNKSNATVFNREIIARAIENLDSSVGLMPLLSANDVDHMLHRTDDEAILESGLEMPSIKSPMRYVKLKNGFYFGKLKGDVMMNNQSKVTRSLFQDSECNIDEFFFEIYSHVRKTSFGPPPMKPFTDKRTGEYHSPYNRLLENFIEDKPYIDKKILIQCVKELTAHILAGLRDNEVDLQNIRPIKMETAINGVVYDSFLRKVNMSKSAGFDYPGVKKKHMEETKDFYYEPNERLKGDIVEILNGYYHNKRMAGFVHNALMKDEARDVLKNAQCKTRLFFPSPLPELVISRMILSPFYTLMVQFPEIFCTSIGIDMHREANKIVEKLRRRNIMGGDYKNFDQRIPFLVSWAAATVVYNVLSCCGYNSTALTMVRGMLTDGLFPYVNMNLDLLLLAGIQCSGKLATAEDNSLKGLLLLMYAWYSNENTRDADFFENNDANTYGDDALNDVEEKYAPYYNDIYYSKFCLENYGMVYTNASKGEVDKPFTSFEECTFLKRHFCYHEGLGKWIAPLDMDSIMKTMMWRIPSGSISETEQMKAIVLSSLYELWFHSNLEQFEKVREWCILHYCRHYSIEETDIRKYLPTYSQLFDSFANIAPLEGIMTLSEEEVSVDDDLVTYVHLSGDSDFASESVGLVAISNELTNRLDRLYGRENRSDKNRDLRALRSKLQKELEEIRENDIKEETDNSLRLKEISITLDLIEKIITRTNGNLVVESSPEIEMKTGPVDAQNMSTHENVRDVGGNRAANVETPEEIFELLDETEYSIANFLERPVEIYGGPVEYNTDFSVHLNVWNLLFSRPSIRAKLKNYAFIRANLNVRIAVTGVPQDYGKIQASYVPFPTRNPIFSKYETTSSLRYGMLIYLSQLEGTRNIDVKCNEPLEMKFNWLSPNSMARIFNTSASVLAGSSSYTDINGLGLLCLNTINKLDTVSGTTSTPVYVYVYAWLSEVKLGCPTATVIELTTESSEESYVGPISGALSGAAKTAAMFQAIPVLKPYALASSKILGGMSDMAANFGFSRPTVDTPVKRMKNEPFQNGANTIQADSDQKISLDPRQEISLNIGGLSEEDIMSFGYIVKRESLLCTVDIPVGHGPSDGPLVSFGINPALAIPHYYSATRTYWQPSLMAMLARMHTSWRGKIKIRAEIVVSNFHRLKLAGCFEPNPTQWALTTAAIDLNKQHVFVFDIQDTQDITFCIDMATVREWMRVLPPEKANRWDSTLADDVNLNSSCLNGIFSMYAMTKLQSPDAAKGAYINFYISGEDMHYNGLKNDFPVDALMTDLVAESGPEISNTCVPLNQQLKGDGKHSIRHFGEEPISVRSVLKRFTTFRADFFTTDNTSNTIEDIREIYPSITPGVNSVLYENHRTNVWTYLGYCYLGRRGGMKFRWLYAGVRIGDIPWVKVSLEKPDGEYSGNQINVRTYYDLDATQEGTVFFSPSTNAGVEFAVPYYETNLWSFMDGNYVSNLMEQVRIHTMKISANVIPGDRTGVRNAQMAIGEDFTYIHLLGAAPYTTSN